MTAQRTTRFEPGPVIVGLVLIVLGILFLLEQTGQVDAGDVIGDWWPLVIVAGGLAMLAQTPRSPVGPLIVIGFGVVVLLTQLDLISRDIWDYAWPVVLMLIGGAIILRRPGRKAPTGVGDEVVEASALFGNNEQLVTSERFRGGSITAIFGGVTLDLRQATLDPAGATLGATAIFGGVEVLVPRGWRVETNGTPILGGLSNKVDPPASSDAPTLTVDVVVIFGSAEIKHGK